GREATWWFAATTSAPIEPWHAPSRWPWVPASGPTRTTAPARRPCPTSNQCHAHPRAIRSTRRKVAKPGGCDEVLHTGIDRDGAVGRRRRPRRTEPALGRGRGAVRHLP